VVVVVPGLAEREGGEPGEVARLVGRLEAPPAEEVAERIDAVGDVVHAEDPHRAAPEHAGEPGDHRAADRDPKPEGGGEAAGRPDQEGAVDEADEPVAHQVRRVTRLRAALGVYEDPAEVRMREAA
jgi:hypothetical protein